MTVKFDGSTLKSTEIEAVRKFAAQFSEHTYTASFLSDAALDWFAYRAGSDLDTDLYAYVMGHQKAANEAEQKLLDAQKSIADLKTGIGVIQNDLRNCEIELEDEREQHRSDSIRAHAQIEDWIALHNTQCVEMQEQARELEAKDAEIIRLKARLFDMIEARG